MNVLQFFLRALILVVLITPAIVLAGACLISYWNELKKAPVKEFLKLMKQKQRDTSGQ